MRIEAPAMQELPELSGVEDLGTLPECGAFLMRLKYLYRVIWPDVFH
tara:strand:- start:491 stop:631 length:141 start_codon:yes stop_codon:yes gene_type:complete